MKSADEKQKPTCKIKQTLKPVGPQATALKVISLQKFVTLTHTLFADIRYPHIIQVTWSAKILQDLDFTHREIKNLPGASFSILRKINM